jgi:DNA modification methylase
VEGNGRAEALAALKETGEPPPRGVAVDGSGTWLVPVLIGVDADTESEAAAYAIDHNALTVLGGNFGQDWAERLYDLDELLPVLTDLDLPPVSIDGDDLDALLDREPEPETESVPEPPEEPTSKRGEIYELGPHRLMCGDAADRDSWAFLFGAALADLVVTDPPYGVEYEGGSGNQRKREKLVGDDRDVYAGVLPIVSEYAAANAALYLWHAGRRATAAYRAVEDAGWTVRSQIIWHKLNAHYGAWMAQYLPKHEPCIYCVREPPTWNGATNEVTVWEHDQPSQNEHHPTQKPVELMARAIRNSSNPNAIVADPFAGSGSTLIAAEQTGRVCYAMEIEPRYCDVIRRRYAEYVKDDSYLP